jgi:hypothetical protein
MITGKVESLTRAKDGLRIGKQWYNADGWSIEDSVRGAEVRFETYEGQNAKGWKCQFIDKDSFQITKAAEPFNGGGNKGGGSFKKGGGYDSEGQRRGNALTNGTAIACALVAAGKIGTGKEAAQAAVQVANYLLKAFDPNGSESPKPQAQKSPAPAPKQESNDDDDLPF